MVGSLVKTHVKTSTRPIAYASSAVIAVTAAGAALGALDPSLTGNTPPHPTLTGSLADATRILANNTRVLGAPFIAIALGLHGSARLRLVGDAITVTVLATNAIPIGIALAHWGNRLLPYIPQLPVEASALAVSIAAWITARDGAPDMRQTIRLAVTTLGLLVAAAGIETWCTPHRDQRSTISRHGSDTVRSPFPPVVGRVVACATDSCAGEALSLQGRTLPFPHVRSVPLGLLAGADRAPSTTRPPQEGSTR